MAGFNGSLTSGARGTLVRLIRRARAVGGRLLRRRTVTRGSGLVDLPADLGPAVDRDRVLAALGVVSRIEGIEPVLPVQTEAVPFWVRGHVVRRPNIRPRILKLIPPQHRDGWWADAPDVAVVDAPVAADAVVLGKFDLAAQPKLRAAYADGRLSLAVRPTLPGGTDGIARSAEGMAIVARHVPSLAPALLAHGTLPDGLSYLVEAWSRGKPLVTAVDLADAVDEILHGLAQVQRGHGLSWVHVSEHWGDLLGRRWLETVGTGIVSPELAEWVDGLLATDGALRGSRIHGDLVASNVLKRKSGVVLVDWEYSAEAPIMIDAAKLHLFSARPEETLRAVLEIFGPEHRDSGDPPTGAYDPVEELGLAHAQLISRYPQRREALRGHRRAEIYERQIRRQLDRLEQVRERVSG